MSTFQIARPGGPLARAAGWFSPASRTLVAVSLVVFAFTRITVPRVFTARESPDELTWVTRSLVPWWYDQNRVKETMHERPRLRGNYYYSIHHPTLARIAYRHALHAVGVYDPPSKRYDYSKTMGENRRLGNILPDRVRTALRLVNVAFVLAALLLFFFGFKKVLDNRLLALLAVLPVALEPTITRDFTSVAHYIGADALLLFWAGLFWFAWLSLKDRGLPGVILMGIIAGLATATKVNAAFMLIAGIVYYGFAARGWRKLVWPLAMWAAAAAVFLALNPVYFGGGIAGAGRVFHDTIEIMFDLKQISTQKPYAAYTRFEILAASLPHGLFLLPVLAVVLAARRSWWFAMTALWSGAIIIGNLSVVYIFSAKYATPVRVAFYVVVMSAGLTMLKGLWAPGARSACPASQTVRGEPGPQAESVGNGETS